MEEDGEGSKQMDELIEEMKTSEIPSPLAALAPSDSLDTQAQQSPYSATTIPMESERDSGKAVEEPSVDWFEPLEEDNDEHDELNWDVSKNGRREAEEESVAGESERSGSVAGSERNYKRTSFMPGLERKRKRRHPDEGWEDWSILGEGWKRKAVVRRSGTSVGQEDVYYMSPKNERVRSRVELAKVADIDLTRFEFKKGVFLDADVPARKMFQRRKKVQRDCSPSSESSWMERGERADSPDFHYRLPVSRVSQPNHKSLNRDPQSSLAPISPTSEDGIKDSLTSSVNGKTVSDVRFCTKCGSSYLPKGPEKQRKKSCCPKCRAKKPVDNRHIVFRKWIPCGQCVACHTTEDCGKCASCKKGMLDIDSKKPVRCRKRKCVCPIRKNKQDGPRWVDSMDSKHETEESRVVESQSYSHRNSETDDYPLYVDVDGDDEDFDGDNDDDYETWVRKRKRRSCGKCEACVSRRDCGTCDFCIDKPKFGGSNKKRQKCRLRQCQNKAMFGLGEFDTQDGMRKFGRPRPHYTYSRNTAQRKRKQFDQELTDDEEEKDRFKATGRRSRLGTPAIRSKPIYGMNFQPSVKMGQSGADSVRSNGFLASAPSIGNNYNTSAVPSVPSSVCRGETQSKHKNAEMHSGDADEEEMATPMITQIFSLAETSLGNGSNMDMELLKLLESTRTTALPTLWYAIMKEGPQMLLVQCSKKSTMTDTVVQISPGLGYQIAVQGQPLLQTHRLYEDHAPHMTSVTTVVNLLLDLEERYRVCQGVPNTSPPSSKEPFIFERASTCDFLILKDDDCCTKCKALTWVL